MGRIQRNWIFGNCRLLNPNNEREGWWLDQEALTSAFRDFVKSRTNEYRSYQSEEINETYDLPDYCYHDPSIDVRQDDWDDYIDYRRNH